jgi:myosin heavy subunit
LLKFCPHALRSELKLLKNGYELKANDFKFLRNSVNVEMITSSDEEMWRDLNSSFEELRFDGGQVLEIYKIIAGVLHLGNL